MNRLSDNDLSVGIVSASLSRAAGGILPIMQAHGRELSKMGMRVTAYGLQDAYSPEDTGSWEISRVVVQEPSLKRLAYSSRFGRDVRNSNHDLLHQHGLWLYPSIAVSMWRKRTRRPVIVSTQGMLEPWAMRNSALKKLLAGALFERENLLAASCIHCSEAEVGGVRDYGFKGPIAVIPNGVDLPSMPVSVARPPWLPADGRRTLLFLGRIHPKKGIRETLEAWRILGSREPSVANSWRLVIAGWDDGGHVSQFQDLAKSLALPNVMFPGPLFGAEKEAAFFAADAFILASFSEGFPMAVLEAWSHSLPVLMTRECNMPRAFEAGAAIQITNRPEELARQLAINLRCQDLAFVGNAGRRLVETKYSWPIVTADLASVYRWLTADAHRPECVVTN